MKILLTRKQCGSYNNDVSEETIKENEGELACKRKHYYQRILSL